MGIPHWLAKKTLGLSVIEWLVVLAIVAVLIALLLPGVEWGSSGDIDLTVRVLVFDAATVTPIPGAKVVVVNAPHVLGTLKDYQERYPEGFVSQIQAEAWQRTNDEGIAIIPYRFQTGASSKNPEPRASLANACVVVLADGYGGAVTPVRYLAELTKDLRAQEKQVVVKIGLIKP